MSGLIHGNKETIDYIVSSMVRARQEDNEVERWILKKYLMEVVQIKIKQKGSSCKH